MVIDCKESPNYHSHPAPAAQAPAPALSPICLSPICERCETGGQPFCIGCFRLKEHDKKTGQQKNQKILNQIQTICETLLSTQCTLNETPATCPKGDCSGCGFNEQTPLYKRINKFHHELKAESEIELIEEQKEFSDGLKESLCILYRWFPELRSPEQKQEPVKKSLADLCPYCNKPMRWDQFKEIWICPTHGKFDKGKDRDLK
jgi:hypothetical protein